jgi:hypothetical protein
MDKWATVLTVRALEKEKKAGSACFQPTLLPWKSELMIISVGIVLIGTAAAEGD